MENLIIIFIGGLLIGSFLNVCIYRIPQGESIISPRSHCVSCGHVLGGLELIPIVSYLVLRGRCKSCKSSISPRYMLIELLTGVAFVLVYRHYGLGYTQEGSFIELLLYLTLTAFLIVLGKIDLEHMLLPTSIIRVGVVCGLVLKGLQSVITHNAMYLIDGVLAGAIGYSLFFIIFYGSKWLLKKEGLGFGDVRLVGLLGLYIGMNRLFLMISVACLMAACYGLVLLGVKKKSEPFPLGPFLNGGAFIVLLWGEQIMNGYLNLLGF